MFDRETNLPAMPRSDFAIALFDTRQARAERVPHSPVRRHQMTKQARQAHSPASAHRPPTEPSSASTETATGHQASAAKSTAPACLAGCAEQRHQKCDSADNSATNSAHDQPSQESDPGADDERRGKGPSNPRSNRERQCRTMNNTK